MATLIIRVLQGKRKGKASGGFFKSVSDLSDAFESIDVLSDSDSASDLELRWTDEKVIYNVVAKEGITSLKVNLERKGYISIRECGSLWYVSNLGRHSLSLSSKALASFELSPIKVDLRSYLSKPMFRGMILENVRLNDLSVDSVASLKVEIPSCTQAALLNLVKGTDARITSFAIPYSSGARLSIATNGSIKVRLAEFDWVEAVALCATLIEGIIEE